MWLCAMIWITTATELSKYNAGEYLNVIETLVGVKLAAVLGVPQNDSIKYTIAKELRKFFPWNNHLIMQQWSFLTNKIDDKVI